MKSFAHLHRASNSSTASRRSSMSNVPVRMCACILVVSAISVMLYFSGSASSSSLLRESSRAEKEHASSPVAKSTTAYGSGDGGTMLAAGSSLAAAAADVDDDTNNVPLSVGPTEVVVSQDLGVESSSSNDVDLGTHTLHLYGGQAKEGFFSSSGEEKDTAVCNAVANISRDVFHQIPLTAAAPTVRRAIAILMIQVVATEFHRVAADLSFRNVATYAHHHNYDFIVERSSATGVCRPAVSSRRTVHWCKVLALEKWLPYYEHILVLDMDVLIMNVSVRIEDHLVRKLRDEQKRQFKLRKNGGGGDKCRFLFTSDANGVNTGVFLAERSQQAMDLLRGWWGMAPHTFHVPFHEQSALSNLLSAKLFSSSRLNEPDRLPAICFVEQRLMNAYPTALAAKAEAYMEGDYLVHFAGCGMKDQDVCSREFRTMFERAVMFAQFAGVKTISANRGDSSEEEAIIKLVVPKFAPSVRNALASLAFTSSTTRFAESTTMKKSQRDEDVNELTTEEVDWKGVLTPREVTPEGVRLALLVHDMVDKSVQQSLQAEASGQRYSWFTVRFPPSLSKASVNAESTKRKQRKRSSGIVSEIVCPRGSSCGACLAQSILQILPYYDTVLFISAAANRLLRPHVIQAEAEGLSKKGKMMRSPLHERIATVLHSVTLLRMSSSGKKGAGAEEEEGEGAAAGGGVRLDRQAVALMTNAPLTLQLLQCIVSSGASDDVVGSPVTSGGHGAWPFDAACKGEPHPKADGKYTMSEELNRPLSAEAVKQGVLVAPSAWGRLLVSDHSRSVGDDGSSSSSTFPTMGAVKKSVDGGEASSVHGGEGVLLLPPPSPPRHVHLIVPVAVAVDLCRQRQLLLQPLPIPTTAPPSTGKMVAAKLSPSQQVHLGRTTNTDNHDDDPVKLMKAPGGGAEGHPSMDVAIVVVCPADSWLRQLSHVNKKRFAARHKYTLYWTECGATSTGNVCESIRDAKLGVSRHMRWAKVTAVQEVLGKHDWVLSMEPDVFFMSSGAMLSDLIEHLLKQIGSEKRVDLLLTGFPRGSSKESSEKKNTDDVVVVSVDPAVMLLRNSPAVFQLLREWWDVPSEKWLPSIEASALSYLLSQHSRDASGGGKGSFVFARNELIWALVHPPKDLNALPNGQAHLGRVTTEDSAFTEGDFAVQFPFCAYRPRAVCEGTMSKILGEL